MNEQVRLLKILFEDPTRQHLNIKFCRGNSESISSEAFCSQVTTAIFARDNGLLEVGEIESEIKQIDVTKLSIPA